MRSFDTAAATGGRTMLIHAQRTATSASIAVVIGPIGRLEGDQPAALRRRLVRRNAGRLRVHRSWSQPRAKLRGAGLAAELLTFSSDRAPMGDRL